MSECNDCRCSSADIAAARGCPMLQISTERIDPKHEEHAHGFELAGAWAFMWAAGTIAMVGLLALAGWAWREYGALLVAIWRQL